MIDPQVAMAFSVYSNKGVYALLIGSGISRPAGIPTGWEIVLELIQKLAVALKEDCNPDPEKWYRDKFNKEPGYSDILAMVAKTPTERQQYLRPYFERSEGDVEQGLKVPTPAHAAIAKLVQSGHIRVILTTNFDRLMEQALESVGISPTVISTVSQLQGALPLIHSGPTIIKLHGDYHETTILNTPEELAHYAPEFNALLDRILDEFGLIICGWSADWDVALRQAIERCKTNRFMTYWADIRPLSQTGAALALHRRAEVAIGHDANTSFAGLLDRVQSLSDIDGVHPLSPRLAAAKVKRLLADPTAKIRLHDFVREETERVCCLLSVPELDPNSSEPHSEEAPRRLTQYQSICETLISILATGAFWDSSDNAKIWSYSLARVADQPRTNGRSDLLPLNRYPALLLTYAAGIAALATENYLALKAILVGTKIGDGYADEATLVSVLYPSQVIDKTNARVLEGFENHKTPGSALLCQRLREPLREFLPTEKLYLAAFDRFEYMFGLIHADLTQDDWKGGWWGPIGCYIWRNGGLRNEAGPSKKIDRELERDGEHWCPLKTGMFNNDIQRARTAKTKFDTFLAQAPNH